jgi:hypothetical protein
MKRQAIFIPRADRPRFPALAFVLSAAVLPCAAGDRIQVAEDTASQAVTFSLGQKPLAVYHNKLDPMPHVHLLYTRGGVNVIAGDSSKLPHPGHWGIFFGTYLSDAGSRLDFFHGAAKEVPSPAKVFQADIKEAKKTGFSQELVWKSTTVAGKVLLKEKRSVAMYQHAAFANATVLEWQTELSCPEGTDKVVLQGYDFAGLGVRMLNAVGDLFGESERCDAGQNNRWIKGLWLAYVYHPEGGQQVTVAVYDHPDNPRHPKNWCGLNRPFEFGYVGPGLNLDNDPYAILAGRSMKLRYCVAAWDGKVGKGEVAAVLAAWRELTAGNAPEQQGADKAAGSKPR